MKTAFFNEHIKKNQNRIRVVRRESNLESLWIKSRTFNSLSHMTRQIFIKFRVAILKSSLIFYLFKIILKYLLLHLK